MKNIIYTLAVLLSICACNKQTIQEVASNDELINVNFSCELDYSAGQLNPPSKAATQGNESTISKSYLFIFNSSDKLVFGREITAAERSSLSLSLRPGSYDAYAICNCGTLTLSSITAASHITDKAVSLASEGVLSSTGPCMYGSKYFTAAAGASCTLSLSRPLARVSLRQVNNRLPSALGALQLKRAYLCNVPTTQSLSSNAALPAGGAASSSTGWANKYGCKLVSNSISITTPIASSSDSDIPTLLFADLSSSSVANGGSYTSTKYFYTYKNASTNYPASISSSFYACATTLMVVAEIGGTEYYYPIALKNGITPNSNTDITLSIEGYGNTAANHFSPISKVSCSGSISVSNWADQTAITETY